MAEAKRFKPVGTKAPEEPERVRCDPERTRARILDTARAAFARRRMEIYAGG